MMGTMPSIELSKLIRANLEVAKGCFAYFDYSQILPILVMEYLVNYLEWMRIWFDSTE